MSILFRKSLAAAAAASLGLVAVTGVGSAAASPGGSNLHAKTLSSAYVGPLQFAVQGKHIFVADSFTSTLSEIHNPTHVLAVGGTPTTDPEASGDLAGVAVQGDRIAYTQSNASHSDTRLTVLEHGKKQLVVNLSKFEKYHNPDQGNRYGAIGTVSAACSALLPSVSHHPVRYKGQVDSHPYAVASLGHGAWAVADAGGNDILKVDRHGKISVIAVLRSQPVKITTAMAAQLGAPACAGITYRFEPVPTDVEVGHGGLYITTLGGAGTIGSVYKLGWSGHAERIATGFAGATNLAVGAHGSIYVAQLFAGVVTKLWHGKSSQVASLPAVAGLEWANGHLFASTAPAVTGGTGPGTIVLLK